MNNKSAGTLERQGWQYIIDGPRPWIITLLEAGLHRQQAPGPAKIRT